MGEAHASLILVKGESECKIMVGPLSDCTCSSY